MNVLSKLILTSSLSLTVFLLPGCGKRDGGGDGQTTNIQNNSETSKMMSNAFLKFKHMFKKSVKLSIRNAQQNKKIC